MQNKLLVTCLYQLAYHNVENISFNMTLSFSPMYFMKDFFCTRAYPCEIERGQFILSTSVAMKQAFIELRLSSIQSLHHSIATQK